MKIKTEIQYPIVHIRNIEKELDIDLLTEYLENRKDAYILDGEKFTKDYIHDLISDFSYDLKYITPEEDLISEDDDINYVDAFELEAWVTNKDELVEYFSYLCDE